MAFWAAAAVPVFVAGIVVWGSIRRVPLFDTFCRGATEGGRAALTVFPSLLALIMAVSMLQASGWTEWLVTWLRPLTARWGFPAEALPVALLRPLSGSGALAALQQLMQTSGTESEAALVACVLQCSTETTFYTLAVYFGAIGVRRTGWALPAAAVGDLFGMVLASLTVKIFLL